jgi:hypothetical protein
LIYDLDSIDFSDGEGVLYLTDSIHDIYTGVTFFNKARQEYRHDLLGGVFSRIVSQNYHSGDVIRIAGRDHIQLRQGFLHNFKLGNPGTITNGITNRQLDLQNFHDSLQRNPTSSFQGYISSTNTDQRRQYNIIYPGHMIMDVFQLGRDTINLFENVSTSGGVHHYSHSRYFHYYRSETPWYSQKTVDHSLFFIRSPYVCDSLVLRNGEFVPTIPSAPYQFSPSLTRKVVYEYTGDTAAIKSFIDAINPVVLDPFWSFTTNRVFQFVPDGALAEGNYTDLYRWMASRSTDSVFLMAGNQRVLRQVTVTTNTVEKDAAGRIIRITSRPANSLVHKDMELFY